MTKEEGIFAVDEDTGMTEGGRVGGVGSGWLGLAREEARLRLVESLNVSLSFYADKTS